MQRNWLSGPPHRCRYPFFYPQWAVGFELLTGRGGIRFNIVRLAPFLIFLCVCVFLMTTRFYFINFICSYLLTPRFQNAILFCLVNFCAVISWYSSTILGHLGILTRYILSYLWIKHYVCEKERRNYFFQDVHFDSVGLIMFVVGRSLRCRFWWHCRGLMTVILNWLWLSYLARHTATFSKRCILLAVRLYDNIFTRGTVHFSDYF